VEKRVKLRGGNGEAIENKATMRCEEEGDNEKNKGFFCKRVDNYNTRIHFHNGCMSSKN